MLKNIVCQTTIKNHIENEANFSNRIMYNTGAAVNVFSNEYIFDTLDFSCYDTLKAANDTSIDVVAKGSFEVLIKSKHYIFHAYYTLDLNITLL